MVAQFEPLLTGMSGTTERLTVEGVLAAVLAAHPWGAKCQDHFGMLPLYYYAHHNKANQSGVAIRMAGNLVGAFPEGKKQLDDRGWRLSLFEYTLRPRQH